MILKVPYSAFMDCYHCLNVSCNNVLTLVNEPQFVIHVYQRRKGGSVHECTKLKYAMVYC